ncbi:MAG: AAA family ATPase, partial [Planctomycetes bacterium]|nr:AAA family ATPase [Planctomycetota bacterium]
MDPHPKPEPGIRILGLLGRRPGGASFLAAEGGRGRRPRWVLRWLPRSVAGPALRADLADLASLSHAALALPVAFRTDPETRRAYLVRPYVDGCGIGTALEGKAPRDLVPWLCAAAEALAILHRAGLAHGSVKPSNLLVPRAALFARAPRGPRVVLCDPSVGPLEPRATPAGDLEALGRIFHGLLTGRAADAGQPGPLPDIRELNPAVPVDLARILSKVLHPDPAKGYRGAGSLLEDLRTLAGRRSAGPRHTPACFVGRDEEVTRAVSFLREAGRPGAIAVLAGAGMGKTAFLRRLALEAGLLGYRPVSIRCYLEAPGPVAPLKAAARELIAPGAPGRRIRARCRRLLEATRGAGGAAPEGESGRRAFARALRELLLEAASPGPVLLLVDDAHLADPLTVEVLAGLTREVSSRDGPGPLSLAVSFRDEERFREALRPLRQAFSARGRRLEAIALDPLRADAVSLWLGIALPDDPDLRAAILRGAGLGGRPFEVEEAIGAAAGEALASSGPPALALGPGGLGSLDPAERDLLEALAVLGRPSPPELLARLAKRPEGELQAALAASVRRGTLSEERGPCFFRLGSLHLSLLEAIPEERRRALHRRAAALLETREPKASREIAHHWLEGGAPRKGTAAAIAAARELSRSHDDRSAIRFFEAALEVLPRGKARWRALAEEAAGACLRSGEHRRGIELVDALLEGLPEATSEGAPRGREAGRLHGRKGVLLHRSGDAAGAAASLEKGLELMAGAEGVPWLRERLWVESELAEIRINQGDYGRAEAACRRALEALAGVPAARGDPGVPRAEMVLLGTLAHLKMRRFEYAEALELFERSLRAGEAVGPVPEKGLIWNNLGT